MPIYEYKCNNCGNEFEVELTTEQAINPIEICKSCEMFQNNRCCMDDEYYDDCKLGELFSDDIYLYCAKCNSVSLEKLISISSFQLKGNGWAKDGYGKGE